MGALSLPGLVDGADVEVPQDNANDAASTTRESVFMGRVSTLLKVIVNAEPATRLRAMRRTGAVFLLFVAACSDDATPASPAAAPDASTDAPLTTDPFCKGRPLLPFCEDFDENALPGKFAEIAGDQALLKVVDDTTAPSPPKVLAVSANAAASVWLRAPRGPRRDKANAFFRVRVDRLDADVDLAAFADEGGHRVTMVVTKDGDVGVRVIDTEAGGPTLRTSAVKIETGVWTSIRWDVRFVDGNARTRLRVGAATAFDAEPIGLAGTDAAERLEIGAESSAAVTLAFDSVTFESNVE